MSSQPRTLISSEEYLTNERLSEYRSEFFDGEMIAMTDASRKHNLISIQYRQMDDGCFPREIRLKRLLR